MADVEDDKNANDFGGGALDITGNMQGGIAADYGGALDLGIGGGPTGAGGFDFGLDRGPREGETSLQGTGLPSIGEKSSLGSTLGTVAGVGLGLLGMGPLGFAVKEAATYGPGAFNSATGRAGGSMLGPGGMPAPGGEIAAVGRGGSGSAGGLLGVGNDMSQADALAALYTLLKAKQGAQTQ